MGNGVFGTVRPADIDIVNDVEIMYMFRPTRSADADGVRGYKPMDPSSCLVHSVNDDDSSVIAGLYELRLPLDTFNQKGFYSVYIRPKEVSTSIVDISVLAAYPDVRGVVFNIASEGLYGISDLTGYRIEYQNGDTRLIKSCNRCDPVAVNNGDGYPNVTRYSLVDTSSDYVFCTVSPSVAPSYKPNASPYIGTPGETVVIANTKFSPQLLEFEFTEHNADTISYMLEGDQVRDRDHGIITTYNDDKEIYHQADYYTVKSRLGEPLYDVKRSRESIDNSQAYDNVIDE